LVNQRKFDYNKIILINKEINMQKITDIFHQYSGILFNLIFIVYAWLYELSFKTVLADYTPGVLFQAGPRKTNILIGCILLIAFIAETIGIFLKSRHIRSVLSSPEGGLYKTPLEGYFPPVILLNLFHLIGAGFIFIIMLNAFGISWESFAGMILLFILFLHALYLGYLTLLAPSDRDYKGKPVTVPWQLLSTFLLSVWGCLGYTIVWENFGEMFKGYFSRPDIFSSPLSIIQFLFVIVGVIIMCFLFFIPTRMGFYIEEMVLLKNTGEKKILILSLVFAVMSAIFPFLGIL
jgi:hypothetical protein